MLAIGPISPEQETFDLHKPIRDKVAALETALAGELVDREYRVTGTHGRPETADANLWAEVLRLVSAKFPRLR